MNRLTPGSDRHGVAAATVAPGDVDALLVALQTCLHLLGEEGYFLDDDFPEVHEALALYERLVGA